MIDITLLVDATVVIVLFGTLFHIASRLTQIKNELASISSAVRALEAGRGSRDDPPGDETEGDQ